ncbi:isochorismatase family protein [Noviherbaspirillum galbum]|uniref:Isochorismatase family protein n=1 Tax=Noviherbaspirillum galbum TaxID=2709383 RepID=A0A6B3SQA4_9BURK|nr:isochorismatase family protein [Noviherbaspirillum galbum]NEX62937.1 isochorismatase family protein [Noviherbaspirillum galbum]
MSRLCQSTRANLLLIDFQERLMPAIAGAETVLYQTVKLAKAASLLGVPIVGTAQSPASLGPNHPRIEALCGVVVEKDAFDASAEPGLLAALSPDRDIAVLAGCEAHVCVLQTALSLRERMRVMVVADAIGSRADVNKEAALRRMAAAGVDIVTTEMMIFEWLERSTHPRFRECLQLIK